MSAPLNSKTARELVEAYQSIYTTEEVVEETQDELEEGVLDWINNYKRKPAAGPGQELGAINRAASNLMKSGGIGGAISRGVQSAQSRARNALGLNAPPKVNPGEKYGPGDGAAAASRGTIGGLIKKGSTGSQGTTGTGTQGSTGSQGTTGTGTQGSSGSQRTTGTGTQGSSGSQKPQKPAAKPSDGAERRTPTTAELRAAQAARAANKSEKDVVKAGIAAGKTSSPNIKMTGIGPVKSGAAYSRALTPSQKTEPTKKSRLDKALSGIGKWNEEVSPYDMVLDYLLSEGHVESVEEAHYVMLEMDQETIQGICESYEDVMEADSLAAMQARREKRLAAQRKREGTTVTGRDFGHDYSLTPAQQKARREAEFKAGIAKGRTKKEEVEVVDEGLTGERYKEALKKGKQYSRRVSEDPAKRATRGGRGGESDFGAGDRGTGNKSRRRRGLPVGDED